MLIFERIKWQNFLSTGNDPIEIDLCANALTLVVGPNGAGKSTLLDALHYVLFGRAYRNINLGQLVNAINDSGLLVEVEFRKGSKKYKIKRGIKPNVFSIEVDGKEIEYEAAKKDTQKYLENEILGFGSRTFKQIVIIGSDGYVPFMRLDTADRRIIIEDLLNITLFSKMNEILKIQQKKTEDDIVNVKIQIEQVLKNIELQKKHVNASKHSTQDMIKDLNVEIEQSKKSKNGYISKIKDLNVEVNDKEKSILDYDNQIKKQNMLEKYRIQIKQNIDRVQRVINLFDGDKNVCPLCTQPLVSKEEVLKEHREQLENLSKGYEVLLGKARITQERLQDILQIQKWIEKGRNDLMIWDKNIDMLDKSIKMIEERIDMLRNQPVPQETLEISKELISTLTTHNDTKKQLLTLQQVQQQAGILLHDTGIKSQIIKKYLPIINKQLNDYLTLLDFFVDFNINSNFIETIKSRYRDTFSYENFSAGQKRRIDLALLFTWRAISKLKNSMDTNILILDEVLDGSLDAEGLDEFLSMLKLFSNEKSLNAFVISHRGDVLADKFEHSLSFSLNGNFSEMEVQ